MSLSATSSRIVSLDQFRGYTIVGMILVNFIGDFAVSPPVLQHHNTYFSYADTIMPGFHFAVGFALRLVLLKRIATLGARRAYASVVRRGLGLVLLSTVLEFGTSGRLFSNWPGLVQAGVWGALAGPLKCQFWETLAIIGVTSIFVLPVIAASIRVRIPFMIACAGLHVLLAHLFYFNFLYARPNWLDPIWGAQNVRGLDGGPLGFLAWSVSQIVGSLAYDCVARRPPRSALLRLSAWSLILMLLGYGLSVLSLNYPRTQPPTTDEGKVMVAASPVLPPARSATAAGILPEPPFVQPTAEEQRQLNYWLMDKRVVTLPFNLFSSGFALAVYALFVLLSDIAGWQIGFFRTFGQNALAAYILHEIVGAAVRAFAPHDSPVWWVGITFASYVGITYLFVRHLEKHSIYIRM
ncbi:MAG TPA: heparan-alpha-glucosaminide N-acetyltransferase domain-containing protein [Gemmataceae bacterium]|nr:heparan-alpha-glucosaminide N-acetyltransferase domain-containing protein [Gemmataceae bacterium]